MGGEGGGGYEEMFQRAERVQRPNQIEAHLDRMALERGRETDLANPEQSAEWLLLNRMMYLLVEVSQEWDPQQRANLRKTIAAFGVIAFSRFAESEKGNFLAHYMNLYKDEEGIELDQREAAEVSHLSLRVGLVFDARPTVLIFRQPETVKLKRLTEIEDPVVTDLLASAPDDDKVGHLLRNIHSLSLKQKVKLLLTLSNEEFNEFKIRRSEGFAGIAADILAAPELIKDKVERIKILSRLQTTTPRYEVEAEIRRRRPENYPPEWDQNLEEDDRFQKNDGLPRMWGGKKITYEEAVKLARFEYARKFYRNIYFPSISRYDNPLKISVNTLYEAFQAYYKQLQGTGKAGTDISVRDLLKAIEYYLEYEPDNRQNCQTHLQVKLLAQMLAAVEGAIEEN